LKEIKAQGGNMNRRDFLKGCPVVVGSLVMGRVIEDRRECCLKWAGAEAVPTFSMVEDAMGQYAKRDVVKYCPVCGGRLADVKPVKSGFSIK